MSSLFSSDQEATGFILEKYITVQIAADYSGYNIQYLRRLLRSGRLMGKKIGQIWLMDLGDFERYLDDALTVNDRRCGPQKYATQILSEVIS